MRHVNGYPVSGQIAILDGGERHSGELRSMVAIPQALIAAEIKQLVLQDFSACRGAKLIASKRGLRCGAAGINIVEKILGIQRIVAQEVERRTVEYVRSALGDGIQLRGATPKFRAVGIRLHLEFLNLIDGGDGGDGIGVGRGVDSAVQQVIGVLRTRAAQRVKFVVSPAHTTNVLEALITVLGESYARPKGGQIQEIAAVQRDVLD